MIFPFPAICRHHSRSRIRIRLKYSSGWDKTENLQKVTVNLDKIVLLPAPGEALA